MMPLGSSSFLGFPENSERSLIYFFTSILRIFFFNERQKGLLLLGQQVLQLRGAALREWATTTTLQGHQPWVSLQGLRQAALLPVHHRILPGTGKLPAGSQQMPLLRLVLNSNCLSVSCIILLFICPPVCWPGISPPISSVRCKVRYWCDAWLTAECWRKWRTTTTRFNSCH